MPPCDSIQLARVDLNLVNKEILSKTLESFADAGTVHRYGRKGWLFAKDGIGYRIDDDGRLVCAPGREAMADELKRAYSKKVIETGAKKFGWNMTAKTPQKLTLKRRS